MTEARREQNRRNSESRYNRLRKAGLCTFCGRVRVVKFADCLLCRRRRNGYVRKYREKQAAAKQPLPSVVVV